MASKSRRLNASQFVLLKWIIGALMGLVSVSTLFNLDGYPLLPAGIACTAMIVSLLWPSGFAKLPPIVWKVYTVGIIPLMAIDMLARDTVPALLNLNTWLIIYRALNHESRREEMQLVLLCLFLQVMTGILTASVIFGLQLMVFSALAICFLVIGAMLEMKIEGDYAKLRDRREWSFAMVVETLSLALTGRNIFLGIGMFSALLSLTALVFIVIPRVDVENKVSLFELKSEKSYSGFSEDIALGDVTDIKNDNSVALRVDVSSKGQLPVVPYWRMLSLDSYDDGRFRLSPNVAAMSNDSVMSPNNTLRHWPDRTFSQVPSSEDRDRWTFYVEPGLSKYLPLPGSFSQMTFEDLSKLLVGPEMHYFSLKAPSSKMVSYQIEGVLTGGDVVETSSSRLMEELSSRQESTMRQSYPQTLLELPREKEARGVFRRLAKKIKGGEELSPREFASRAAVFLADEHSYSMSSALPGSALVADPVARWLTSDAPGHCEFFATSLVMLSRAAGYPARTVVGYKGGEWNAYENYYMVKNSDAHAWCEVFDGVDTWFRVDPTPGSTPVNAEPLMANATELVGTRTSKAYLDSLRMLWYRRIVNFDEQAQREAALQLKDFFLAYAQVAERWTGNAIGFLYDWATSPWHFWRIAYFVFLGLILVAAIAIQRNMALNYRELILALVRRGDPIRGKAGKILSRLDSVEKELWGDAERKVVEHLKRLRYGAKSSWPDPRSVFKESRRLR